MIIGKPLLLGGGGGDVFAFIVVTYPAGSVCTCSDGTKTLTAKDTSGSWVFNIPYAGTWVVHITDSVHPDGKDSLPILINNKGTSEYIIMSYNVPQNYQEVEYIESVSGKSQYIVPDFEPNVTDTFEYKYKASATNVNTEQYIYSGVKSGGNNNRYNFGVAGNHTIAAFYTKIDLLPAAVSSNVPFIDEAIVTPTLFSHTVDNVYVGQESISLHAPLSKPYLFCRATGTTRDKYWVGRLFYFEVYKNGVLIHHLTPAYERTNQIPGLYDNIDDKFYVSQSSNPFIAGGDI